MYFSIVIATYQRSDGQSINFLTRALNSIKNQTHQDFKLFLIGDKYEDSTEFESIATSILPEDKIYFENLPTAVEREKYTEHDLWCCGGVNAMNTGIQRSLDQGFEWAAHLDHDDYWSEDHLDSINNAIELHPQSNFVYTCSTHKGLGNIRPKNSSLDDQIHKVPAKACNVVHSSVCFNVKAIDLRYRDCLAEIGKASPADADLWWRISTYEKLCPLFVDKLTCFQPQQGI
jgi:glycosyltransferase involved in cell wall biosynthesis